MLFIFCNKKKTQKFHTSKENTEGLHRNWQHILNLILDMLPIDLNE